MKLSDLNFEESFFFAAKLSKSMMYGLLLYMAFVELSSYLHWPVYFFIDFDTVRIMGMVFIVLTIVIFALSSFINKIATKEFETEDEAGTKLLKAQIAVLAVGELITIFGLTIFITSANKSFFYLFYAVSLFHLWQFRPKAEQWQSKLSDKDDKE